MEVASRKTSTTRSPPINVRLEGVGGRAIIELIALINSHFASFGPTDAAKSRPRQTAEEKSVQIDFYSQLNRQGWRKGDKSQVRLRRFRPSRPSGPSFLLLVLLESVPHFLYAGGVDVCSEDDVGRNVLHDLRNLWPFFSDGQFRSLRRRAIAELMNKWCAISRRIKDTEIIRSNYVV